MFISNLYPPHTLHFSLYPAGFPIFLYLPPYRGEFGTACKTGSIFYFFKRKHFLNFNLSRPLPHSAFHLPTETSIPTPHCFTFSYHNLRGPGLVVPLHLCGEEVTRPTQHGLACAKTRRKGGFVWLWPLWLLRPFQLGCHSSLISTPKETASPYFLFPLAPCLRPGLGKQDSPPFVPSAQLGWEAGVHPVALPVEARALWRQISTFLNGICVTLDHLLTSPSLTLCSLWILMLPARALDEREALHISVLHLWGGYGWSPPSRSEDLPLWAPKYPLCPLLTFTSLQIPSPSSYTSGAWESRGLIMQEYGFQKNIYLVFKLRFATLWPWSNTSYLTNEIRIPTR